jgi:hypothetical protein
LGDSLTEGKWTFNGRTGRSPEVVARLEREGGEERKNGEEEERGQGELLCPEGRQSHWCPTMPRRAPALLSTVAWHRLPRAPLGHHHRWRRAVHQ